MVIGLERKRVKPNLCSSLYRQLVFIKWVPCHFDSNSPVFFSPLHFSPWPLPTVSVPQRLPEWMCGWSVGVACLWRACLMGGEKGLIGPDSLILKRASRHFMACLVMCPSGEKNLNHVSFLSQGGFITSPFLQVSQGWAVVPGLFGYMFISLSVLVSVIQFRCQPMLYTHHCVLPPILWGSLLSVLGHGHDLCVWACLAPPLMPVGGSCCYHVCFESDLGAIKSTYCKHCNFFRCTHHVLWRQSSRSYQEPLSQMVIEAKGVSQAPFPLIVPYSYTHVFRCHFLNVKCFFSGIISRCLRYS